MAIKIVQATRAPESDLRRIELDLTRKTGVLIRQSKKGAELEFPESRLRQRVPSFQSRQRCAEMQTCQT